MVEFFSEYGLFLAKSITIVVAILFVVGSVFSLSHRNRGESEQGHIEVKSLNEHYEGMADTLKQAVFTEHDYKQDRKKQKKQHKADQKKQKKEEDSKSRIYVLDFDGDIEGSDVGKLKEEINAILTLAEEKDEVIVNLESPGGMVHAYGLGASQLKRIKEKSIVLTVCVDKVAASGGYMMACIADKILAAPFALIGSIGVMAEVPNFHRLLTKYDVDYDVYTAGEFKRTVTTFGQNTDKGKEKFREELHETHELFKQFIADNREQVDVDSVSTGEAWYGARAIERNLIDEIQTSDAYLMDRYKEADIYQISFVEKKSLQEKLGFAAHHALDLTVNRWLRRAQQTRYFS